MKPHCPEHDAIDSATGRHDTAKHIAGSRTYISVSTNSVMVVESWPTERHGDKRW
jgi:hypothetical protein